MTARLVRALYKGGVTAPVSPDAWGVWRSQDRRGRVIGRLVDRDIERLQLRGHLKSVGEGDAALIWSGPPIDETGDVDGAPHIAQRDPIARAASTYVEQLILKQSAPAFREALRRAVQAFPARHASGASFQCSPYDELGTSSYAREKHTISTRSKLRALTRPTPGARKSRRFRACHDAVRLQLFDASIVRRCLESLARKTSQFAGEPG